MAIGGVIGSIAGGLMQSSSASKAAKAQEAAANKDIEFQKETRDLIRADLKPFYDSGTNALAAYNFELGLGSRPTFGGNTLSVEEVPGTGTYAAGYNDPTGSVAGSTQPLSWLEERNRRLAEVDGGGKSGHTLPKDTMTATGQPTTYKVGDQTFATRAEAQAYADANSTPGMAYQGFELSPDYLYQIDEGAKGINALAGAGGGLLSGKTLEALTTMRQGIAAQGRNNYLNRLAGLTDTGQSAAAMQGTASSNAAAGVSNALAGIGNAQAAGAIGQGNAWSNAFSDISKWMGYQNGQSGYP